MASEEPKMGDYGDMYRDFYRFIAVIGFLGGLLACGIGWLLWHYVLQHLAWK